MRATRRAEPPDRGTHERSARWLTWGLRAALVAVAAYVVVTGAGEPLSPAVALITLGAGAALGLTGAYARKHTDHPRMLARVEALALASLTLHLIGHAFRLYWETWAFDDMFHFATGAGSVYLLHALAVAWRISWLWRWGTPMETGVHAFAMAVTMHVLWELGESAVDMLTPADPVRDFYGTAADLATGMAGAAVAAVVAARNASQTAARVERRGAERRGRLPG